MILSRNQFIIVLLLIFIGPFIFYKAAWISTARHTTGTMWFEGHTLELQGISAHPVNCFEVDHKDFFLNGNLDFEYKKEQAIPVLYQNDDPSNAKIDSFATLWLDTIVYMLLPLGIILVIALTPERFSPLLPRDCVVKIGKRPFIKIIGKGIADT